MIPWPPDSPLNTPLSACPSLGPESLETLAKKSIFTRLDLLLVPPLFYRDRRLVVSLADAEDQNDIVFIGRVISSRQGVAASGRAWLKIDVVDGDDLAHLWFFHNIEYLSRLASVGQTLLISGQIYLDNRGWPSLDHPEICLAEKAMDNFLGVKPIYRAYPGIPPTVLKRVIAETLSDIPSSPKVLPAEWLKSARWPDPVDLLAIVHAPPPNPGILPAPTSSRAYHRLATFELMFWRLL
ncbi:MAG: hypothetical protein LBT38_01080, partial [Deltaproteobacteria bacterium]|nr:hypothetical protein [Deltaproteobacteria bacterium]